MNPSSKILTMLNSDSPRAKARHFRYPSEIDRLEPIPLDEILATSNIRDDKTERIEPKAPGRSVAPKRQRHRCSPAPPLLDYTGTTWIDPIPISISDSSPEEKKSVDHVDETTPVSYELVIIAEEHHRRLKDALIKSGDSQRQLDEYNSKVGLRTHHSLTQWKVCKSRRALRNAYIPTYLYSSVT